MLYITDHHMCSLAVSSFCEEQSIVSMGTQQEPTKASALVAPHGVAGEGGVLMLEWLS